MSTTIDSKVVEMRFDNKHFESNVQTSLSTLEKLKQKLNLSGATKGLENVNTAVKNVNMSSLGSGIETVQAKFSALQVVGVTALANLTNSAVNAGKRIVSALTIDPVKTGLSEYETKINAVQVIQANTRSQYTPEEIADGKQMNEIKSALEELNLYADKTIYNFAQMTNNVGKFVAQGLSIKEATNAVQGMANLAAASGASAEDMARATYQMSQALGGTIRLMDWNSLRNANMATVDLKNTLIDLAKVNGIAIDDMIAKHGTFEQTLQDGWLTGKMFSEAMNIYSGVYSEAELKAKGFTDAQIENFMSLSKMAESAATEVKTFTQLWDVLKETAQSGWTQTWELIIGDFEEAKKTLTALQVYFSDIINGWSNARNFLVSGVMDFGSLWSKIEDKLGFGAFEKIDDVIKDVTKNLEYFQDIVDKVWRGDYKNSDTGRFELLEEAGYDHRVVQDLVNKGRDYALTMEDVEASHKKFGITMVNTNNSVESTAKVLSELSEEELKNAGLTEDEIELFKALAKESERTGKSIETLAKNMSENSGRTLLIDSFKNIGNAISGVATVIKEAWVEIFKPPTSSEIIIKLYNIISALNEFTKKLRYTDEEGNVVNNTFDKIKRTVKGVFAAFDVVLTLIGGPLKIAFKVFTTVLRAFDMDILGFTASIGDVIVRFSEWLDRILDFEWIIDEIVPVIENVIKSVKDWFAALRDGKSTMEDSGKAAENFKTIMEGVNTVINGFKLWISKSLSTGLTIAKKVLDLFGTDLLSVAAILADYIIQFRDWIKENTIFIGVADKIAKVIQVVIEGVRSCVQAFLKLVPVQELINKIGNAIARFFGKIGEGFGSISFDTVLEKIEGFFAGIKTWIEGLSDSENIGVDIVMGIAKGIAGAAAGVVTAIFELVKTIITAFCSFLGIHSPSVVFMGLGTFLVLGLIIGIKNAGPQAFEAIKEFAKGLFDSLKDTLENSGFDSIKSTVVGIGSKIVDTLKTFFKDFNWTDLSAILLGVGSFILGKKTLDTIGMFGKAAEGLGSVLSGIGSFVTNLGQGIEKNLKASALQKTATAVLIFAAALGVLAGSIYLLTKIDVDSGKMWECYGMLAALMGLVLAMTVISSFISRIGGDGSGMRSALMMVGMAAAIYLIATALSKIADVSDGDLTAVYKTLLTISLIVAAFTMISVFAGKNAAKAGSMLLKISVALLIMVGVIKLMSKLDDGEIKRGLGVIKSLSTFVAGLIAVSILAGANANRAGSMLLKMSVAMLIMVGVFKLIGLLKDDEIKRGLTVIETLGTFAIVLVGVSVLAGKNAGRAGSMLLTMSIAIMAMVGAIALIGKLTDEEIKKGMDVVKTLGLFAIALVAVSKIAGENAAKAGSMLLTMSFALGILTGVIYLLTKIAASDSKNMYKALGAVAVLELLFIGLIAASKNASGATGTIIAMAITLAILSGVLIALSQLPQEGLPTATACLAGLIGVFALLVACVKFAPNFKGCMKTFGAALLVVAALTAVLIALSFIEPGNAMANVKALSVLLIAFSSAVLILSVAKGFTNALPTLGAMAIITIALSFILMMLSDMNISASIETVTSLSILLLALAGTTAILSMIGPSATMAVQGAFGLLGVIAVLGLAGMLIGDIMSSIKPETISKWKTGLEEFMDFIIILATGLGEAIGALVGGIFGGVLVGIGESLSDFMSSIQGFLDGLSNVDSGAIDGAKAIAEILLILVGVEALNKLSDLIPGKDDLSGFGSKLVAFGRAMVEFSSTISGKIDIEAVNAAANAGSLMAALAKDLPNTEGLWGWLAGKEDLEGFGNKLVPFGRAIVKFSETVAGKVDVGAVEAAAAAGEIMVALAKDMPNTEGLLGWITGKEDLEGFGNKLVPFGRAMVRFSSIVAGNIDQSAFEAAKAAGDVMVALAKDMPNTGGLLGWITGKEDLKEFGDKLVPFGRGMVKFSSIVAGNIDQKAVESAKAAGDVMIALAESLPEDGNWWTAIFGGNQDTLDSFGAKIVKFGESMVAFSDVISEGINISAVASVTNAAKTVADMAVMLNEKETDLSGLNDSLTELGESMVEFSETIATIDNIGDISTISFIGLRLAKMAEIMPEEVDLARVTNGLSTFGRSLVDFSKSIGEDFDVTTIDTATTAGDKIVKMIAGVPPEFDVLTFAAGIARLGSALSSFATSTVGLDTATVEVAAEAGKKITEFIETIPDYVEMHDFIAYVPSAATAIKFFSQITSGIDPMSIQNAATAGTYINSFIEGIPDYIDMTDFIANASKAGATIRDFGINTANIDAGSIINATDAGGMINDFLKSIPQYVDIGYFLSSAPKVASAIKSFAINITDVSLESISNATKAGKKITDFMTTIPQYVEIGDFLSLASKAGSAIRNFSINVSNINTENIAAAIEAGKSIKKFLNKLKGAPDVSDFVNTLNSVRTALKNFAVDMASIVMPDASTIISSFESLANVSIVAFVNKLTAAGSAARDAGVKFVRGLSTGIAKTTPHVVSCTKALVLRVSSSLSGLGTAGATAGKDLGNGLVLGIRAKREAAYNAGYALGRAAVQGEKDGQASNSPSKLTIQAGKWLGEGLVIGIGKMARNVYTAGHDLGDAAVHSISNTISKIADAVNTDIDVNPTIRPVLDLSDVEANAGLISGMISSDALVGVSANVSAINSMMNNRNQNGVNDDVVSAIGKLGKRMDNLGNTTYNVNGITYDDGSNVSGAVKALVREVKIQRRV